MTNDPDLEACAAEPIRIPGTVQDHGALLGLSEDGVVVRASANVERILGITVDELLGRSVDVALPGVGTEELWAADPTAVNPLRLESARGDVLDGMLSRAGGMLVLEVEPASPEDAVDTSSLGMRALLQRLQAATDIPTLASATALEVRRLLGFDRVMVYRFDPAWNGEVIAEARRDDLEPFLGLWYPASDIPPQARELYAATWLRSIADVEAPPSPILPQATGLDGSVLDLSDTTLRSVSPVHLEYLRNMGVRASLSISLKEGGRLWGLVACHQQDAPHRPSARARVVAEVVGQLVSTLLPTVEDAGALERRLELRARRGALADATVGVRGDVLSVLAGRGEDLLALTGATGVAVCAGGRTVSAGDVPPADALRAIVAAVAPAAPGEAGATDCLADVEPSLEAVKDVASGALVVPVGAGADQFVAWFRPERLREVAWGGDPRNKVLRDGARLAPRLSFERWTETVRLHSTPWQPAEIDSATWLGRHLADVLLREAQARDTLADTLARTLLLEQLPTLPGAAVAARYRPGDGGGVGGDWYDVFWLPDGRVAIAVGDVAGHGVSVAPAMAQLRHGLRAYLLNEATPGEALERLNELVGHLLPDDLASVVVADLEPRTGTMRIANAGHLPALVAAPGEAGLVHDGHGPALGVVAAHRYGQVELGLEPGSTLLLYTDGLVEVRDEPLDVGLERLRDLAAALPPDLDDACDTVFGLARGDDDVTLLALRRG